MRNALCSCRRTKKLLAIVLIVILLVLQVGSKPAYADTEQATRNWAGATALQVNKTDGKEKLEGVYLSLRVKPANVVYWTTVEWQDGAGIWHLVDGWTGYTQNGALRWYADNNLLGKGPFRWNVYTQDRCCLLVPGIPFMLPKQPGATVVTSANIGPCSWAITTNYLFP